MVNIPRELSEIIGDAQWTENTVGMSDSRVYRLSGIRTGGNAYLKVANNAFIEPLQVEAEILDWLVGKLNVPRVLHYEKFNDYEFLLISEMEGNDAKHLTLYKPQELGRILAQNLLKIHQLDISDCPFNSRLDRKLEKAALRVKKGWVVTDDFEPEYRNLKPEEILHLLTSQQPLENPNDLVFTHGDFSLANIIVSSHEQMGLIDWGRGGIADRHQDLAIMIRSLRHNLGERSVQAFINAYGRNLIDLNKIDYYIMLDELF